MDFCPKTLESISYACAATLVKGGSIVNDSQETLLLI